MQTLYTGTPSVTVRDTRGAAVRSVSYNRTSAAQPAEARIARQTFDAAGNPVSSIDPRLFTASRDDVAVRPNLLQITGLSKQASRTASVDAGIRASLADVRGLPVWTADGKRQSRRREYDAANRPTAVHERSGGGAETCRERFIYGEGERDASARNLRGQLARRYDAAGLREIGGYGLAGQPLRDGMRFQRTLRTLDWPDGEADCEALLEADSYRQIRCYGASGETLALTDAAGHARRWSFGVAGQLRSSVLQLQGSAQAIEIQGGLRYGASGQLLQARDGNGVVKCYQYEVPTQRLSRMTARRESDGAMLQDLRYRYDPVGNVASLEDASRPVQYFRNQKIDPVSRYRYDALYQLVEAQGRESAAGGQQSEARSPAPASLEDASRLSNYTREYEYDAGGNLLRLAHRGAKPFVMEMAVSAVSNRALKTSAEAKRTDIEAGFDENGNLKALEAGQALDWDERNRLRRTVQTAHRDGSADDEWYVYDGDGRRLRKTRHWRAGSQWQIEEVRYLPGLELHERRQTNQAGGEAKVIEQWQVARQDDARLLRWTQGLPDGLSNDRLRYGVADHLGSPVLELDESGQIISREEYYPYGGTALWAGRGEVEADYKTVRYSGKERDRTGLYYYGYRYYAPWLARWLNPDPARSVDGLNLFRFVRNRPMSLIDGDGRAPHPAKVQLKQELPGLIGQAQEMVTNALDNLDTDGGMEIVETFFGSSDVAVKDDFREKLQKIDAGMKRLTAKSFIPLEYINFNKNTQAQIWTGNLARFNRGGEGRYIRISYANSTAMHSDDIATTIVHEMSHMTARTHDFVYRTDYEGRSPYITYALDELIKFPRGNANKEHLMLKRKVIRDVAEKVWRKSHPDGQGAAVGIWTKAALANADSIAMAVVLMHYKAAGDSRSDCIFSRYQNSITGDAKLDFNIGVNSAAVSTDPGGRIGKVERIKEYVKSWALYLQF